MGPFDSQLLQGQFSSSFSSSPHGFLSQEHHLLFSSCSLLCLLENLWVQGSAFHGLGVGLFLVASSGKVYLSHSKSKQLLLCFLVLTWEIALFILHPGFFCPQRHGCLMCFARFVFVPGLQVGAQCYGPVAQILQMRRWQLGGVLLVSSLARPAPVFGSLA